MSLWLAVTFGALTLGSVLALLLSLYWDLSLKDRLVVGARLSSEFSADQPGGKKEALFSGPAPAATDQLSPWLHFARLVEQARVPLNPAQVLALAAVATAAVGAAVAWLVNPPLGLLAGLAAGGGPVLFVYRRRQARLDRLLAQLPEALDLMSRFLAAGLSLPRAVQTITRDFDPPLAEEFAACGEQVKLGLPFEIAFRDLAARIGLLEFKILALAMLVHQQTGGNLVPLLEKLSRVVRQRLRFAGHVRALTAEGRMQAAVLIAMPPLVFGALLVLNPGYAKALLDYPALLAGVVLSMSVGAFWVHRIVRIDV